MVVQYSHGSVQPLRMDNRENEFDSGIRVTCAYHLVPTSLPISLSSKSSSSGGRTLIDQEQSHKVPVAQLLYSVAASAAQSKEKEGRDLGSEKSHRDGKYLGHMQKIDVKHDQ